MDTIETLALQAINAENPREIRNLLGQFATGVTVITTRGKDGRKIGMTANSFSSLSLDPPLILWSLSKTAPSLSDFVEAEYFAIHMLAQEHHRFRDILLGGLKTNLQALPISNAMLAFQFCPMRSQPWFAAM